jgi:hypothetical protein
MDGGKCLNRLQVCNDSVADQKVQALAWDVQVFVKYRQINLPLERNAAQGQFVTQGPFINAFEEARPKEPMDFNGCPNRLMGQFLVLGRYWLMGH